MCNKIDDKSQMFALNQSGTHTNANHKSSCSTPQFDSHTRQMRVDKPSSNSSSISTDPRAFCHSNSRGFFSTLYCFANWLIWRSTVCGMIDRQALREQCTHGFKQQQTSRFVNECSKNDIVRGNTSCILRSLLFNAGQKCWDTIVDENASTCTGPSWKTNTAPWTGRGRQVHGVLREGPRHQEPTQATDRVACAPIRTWLWH